MMCGVGNGNMLERAIPMHNMRLVSWYRIRGGVRWVIRLLTNR